MPIRQHVHVALADSYVNSPGFPWHFFAKNLMHLTEPQLLSQGCQQLIEYLTIQLQLANLTMRRPEFHFEFVLSDLRSFYPTADTEHH